MEKNKKVTVLENDIEPQVELNPLNIMEEKPKKTKKKLSKKMKKKIITIGVIGLVLFGLSSLLFNTPNIAPHVIPSDITPIKVGEILDTISATGKVESQSSHIVYGTQNYKVKEVLVKVGDVVEAGDVLAQLDNNDLNDKLQIKKTTTNITAASAQQQVKSAQDSYNQIKNSLDSGLNTSVLNAKTTLDTACNNLAKAERTYQDALEEKENGTFINLESSVDNSEISLDYAYREYDKAIYTLNIAFSNLTEHEKTHRTPAPASPPASPPATSQSDCATCKSLKADIVSKQFAIDQKTKEIQTAKNNVPNAEKSLSAYKTENSNNIEGYSIAIKEAKTSYENALKNYEAVILSANNSLQTSANSLNSAEINANNGAAKLEISQIQQDIESTTIISEVAGTVTAVYATVGNVGSGILFVVEDVSMLEVDTDIDEYDVDSINKGMPVTIKSDALNQAEYLGVVRAVAPTANKNSVGETDTSDDILYETNIDVSAKDTKLKIGMTVRIEIILEQEDNAYIVPYESIYKNAQGIDSVMLFTKQDDTIAIIEEKEVIVGIESDVEIQVIGDGFTADSLIITNPNEYIDLIGEKVAFANEMVGGE